MFIAALVWNVRPMAAGEQTVRVMLDTETKEVRVNEGFWIKITIQNRSKDQIWVPRFKPWETHRVFYQIRRKREVDFNDWFPPHHKGVNLPVAMDDVPPGGRYGIYAFIFTGRNYDESDLSKPKIIFEEPGQYELRVGVNPWWKGEPFIISNVVNIRVKEADPEGARIVAERREDIYDHIFGVVAENSDLVVEFSENVQALLSKLPEGRLKQALLRRLAVYDVLEGRDEHDRKQALKRFENLRKRSSRLAAELMNLDLAKHYTTFRWKGALDVKLEEIESLVKDIKEPSERKRMIDAYIKVEKQKVKGAK